MNRLPKAKRIQALNLLVEGNSMRSVSRVLGISINTVTKLLVDAGIACERLHDAHMRDVQAQRVQVGEIWAFCYSKARNVPRAQAVPEGAGDVWTWTGIDSDSKLIISWYVSAGRESLYAIEFMDDLRERLASRVQLSSDGHRAYLEAVEGAFGGDVDYAQVPSPPAARPASAAGSAARPRKRVHGRKEHPGVKLRRQIRASQRKAAVGGRR